jgi:hypothetical protein
MLKYTLILSLIISSVSLAGGHGGGVMMISGPAKQINSIKTAQPKEIVFHMGQQDGLIKFAYGQFIDKKWDIKEVTISTSELSVDESAAAALIKSKNLNQWVELK